MPQNNNAPENSSSGTFWKKQDLFLIPAVLAPACLLFFIYRFMFSTPAAYAEVSVDGQTVMELDLNKDTVLTIDGWNGGTNTITVQDGAVSVTEASCPDHVCVQTGPVSRAGELIVCLPNRMIVTVIQGGD